MAIFETAQFKLIKKDGDFEIREYTANYTAAVEEENLIEAEGFNKIFSYISGSNKEEEKISMTTPVINELKEGSVTTEFVLPSKYIQEVIPEPRDGGIKIKKNEKRLSAAVKFSGSISENKINEYEEKLSTWLNMNNLKPDGVFRLARYNPPFVPALLRRNEILVDIKGGIENE